MRTAPLVQNLSFIRANNQSQSSIYQGQTVERPLKKSRDICYQCTVISVLKFTYQVMLYSGYCL